MKFSVHNNVSLQSQYDGKDIAFAEVKIMT